MWSHGIASLRYSTTLDSPEGMVSYHVVLHKPYDTDRLKSQARNGVKRGLEHFKVEQIPFERLGPATGYAGASGPSALDVPGGMGTSVPLGA